MKSETLYYLKEDLPSAFEEAYIRVTKDPIAVKGVFLLYGLLLIPFTLIAIPFLLLKDLSEILAFASLVPFAVIWIGKDEFMRRNKKVRRQYG